MATQIGQLKYSVGFDVKKQDLNTLKTQLQQLKKLSLSDLMKINQSDRTAATESFRQIREQAEYVEKAIKDAFNVKLNTTNIETFNKSLKDSGTSLEKVYNTFKQGGVAGQNAFRSLVTQVTTANTQLKQTHKFLDNIATTLANTVKWNIASSAVNALSNSVQQAWGYVKSLDTSLNDIRIVTGKSAEQMAKFSEQANAAAQSLGKTTVDYTKAALIYAQQGLSDEDIATRAAITLKTANVTGQSTDAVSEQLTSVWNGYKVSAEEAELYIDRLAAVAATTASDLEQLSTGMSKVAAAAAAMGVGQEQLAAQLSTIISVTRQAPESVGTALRTVYARISDIKAGLDEDGVTLGNYSSKMADLGFKVLDVNDNLRDMGEVIEEIGGRWGTLSREQQVSLAQTMAGQRQYSNLIALFDNFDKYTEALHTAQNAAGTLQKQQDTYMESTRAHLNQLKAATEDLYDSLINADSIQPLIDALTTAASLAARFVDSLGGGGTLLLSLGGIAANVFSDQLTKGVETFVHNLSLGNQQVKIMEASLGVFDQVIHIDKLDSSTKAVVENLKNTEQSLAKRATPNQFNQMNDSLGRITTSVNEYNKVVESGIELDKQFQKAQNAVGVSFGNIQNFTQQSEETQNKFSKTLQTTFNGYNEVIGAIDNFSSSLNRQNGQIQVSDQNVTDLINDLNSIKDTNFLGEGFELPKQNIDDFISQLEKMRENGSDSSVFKDFTDDIKNYFQDLTDATGITVDSIIAKVDQMREAHKKTAQEIEAQQKALQKIKTEQTYRAIGKLAGGFIQLGTAINQASNAGKLFAQGKIGQAVTNIGTSLVTISTGALSAAQAMQTLGIATNMALGWLTGIIAVAAAATSAIMGVVKAQQAELEATIKLKQERIDYQNRKQEQIENNKKLYSSIEELNKQYKQGQITRIQLRSAVEDLIDQYGVEGIAIRQLAGDYDALTEAIKRKRLEAVEQGKRSAQSEIGSARELITDVARQGRGRESGENYILDLIPGWAMSDESQRIKDYFKQIGAIQTETLEGAVLRFTVDFDSGSIVDLYNKIDKIIKKIQQDATFTDKQKADSEIYKTAVEWRDRMAEAIEKYRDAQQDLIKYQSELNILHTTELNDVKTTNDYLAQRENIVKAIQQVLDVKGDKTSNAEEMADAYLRDNYRQLFIQFNQGSSYIQKLRDQLGGANKAVESLISDLDSEHLGKLIDIVDLDNIQTWQDLEEEIRKISSIDLSNVEAVIGPSSISGAKEAAAQRYTFLQSLEDQVKGGKSISSTEFKRVSQQFPQLQQYFTMLANGQYKMTDDAKEFYNTVDSLKLDGFKNVIAQINNEIERTERLSEKTFDYDALQGEAYHVSKEYGQRQLGGNRILTDDNGNIANVAPKITEYVEIEKDLAQQQIDFLRTVKDKDTEFQIRLDDLQKTILSEDRDLEDRKEAVIELSNAVNAELEKQTHSVEELSQALKQTEQAMYDALFPTDADIQSSTLYSLTQVIQDLADDNSEFAKSLDDDARAAENVAQAILRFNNAIEDMVKNYETWHGVLTNENVTIQQLAEVMQPLRDAYADLLDMDGSSLSAEFLQSAQNLQLMKAAIDGNIESYQQLRQLAAQDIITHLTFDTEEARSSFMTEFNSILEWMNDHTAEFKIGASFDEQKYSALIGSLTNLINATQMTAAQASDLLHDAFGIDAEVIQQTKTEPVKHTITGYTANVADRVIPGTDPLTGAPVTYHIPSIRYNPQILEIQDQVAATGVGLKIINAHKSSGGQIKWKHSAQGGGAAGVKRRTQAAEKAAKAEPKPDTSTKEEKKPMKDDRDIYHDINIELEQINRQLSRAQKVQERLFGKQLIDNLNKQSQILEQHKAKLKEKQALQKLDLAQKREELSLLGATFNEYGHISNYLDILASKQGTINGLIAQYNTVVASYNATTVKETKDAIKDQLTEIERQIKEAESDYKELQSQIKNYDSLQKAIQDIIDQVEEQTQKQIEINISKFKMAVEIRLQMGQAERDWNEFRRKVLEGTNVLKDTGFDTLFKDATQNYRDIYSYFDIHGNNRGQIASLTDQVNDTLDEIEKIQNKEESIYGDNMAQAIEDLNNYASKLQDSMINVRELINQIDQAYLDTYDDIADQMDKQIDDYEFLNDLIEHDIDLLQLLYGDRQYEAMSSYYTAQYDNQLNQIEFLREAVALVKERWQLQEAAGNTNAAQKLKEQYKDLVSDLNSLVEASVKTLQDKYTNAINQIFDALDKRVTGGLGTDYLQMEWELINKNADEYLDTINSAFALQELEAKFQKAIGDTQNVKNQRILTDLMNQQLDQLRSKEKLTQYDVDRAEKLLGIEQARMALEDQRSAKTSLRLKRDSQGNYSYVYAANEEDVSAAEDNLAKLQNDLYNFDKDAYRRNLDDMLSAWRDFQSKYKEIVLDTSLSQEERIERLALLRDQYGEYINNKVAENEVIRTNLMESAFIDYAALYNGDYEAYRSMIDNQRDALMNDLVPQWNSGIQQMVESFVGAGGFIPACEQGFNELDEATQQYENQLKSLQQAADVDFSLIREGALDPTAESFKELIKQNDALIQQMQNELNDIDNLKAALDGLLKAYQSVWKAADDASRRAHEALQDLRDVAAKQAEAADKSLPTPIEPATPSLPSAPQAVATTPVSTPPSTSSVSASLPTTPTTTQKAEETFNPNAVSTAEGIAGNIYYGGSWKVFYQPGEQFRELLQQHGFVNGLGLTQKAASKLYDQVLKELGRIRIIDPGPKFQQYYLEEFDYEKMRNKNKWGYGTSGFDTGGYTGAWGPQGRLAVLHQKELVLNAQDTKNMLDSVEVLRGIVTNLGGSISARLNGLNGGYTGSNPSQTSSQVDQNVSIQANFPNVNSKREIEEAFSELVNLAAQRALRR